MRSLVWRISGAVVAALLCVWALVLYFSSYELTYESDGVTVSCYSVAKVGDVGRAHLDHETQNTISRNHTFTVISGEAAIQEVERETEDNGSEVHVEDRIEYACDRARTARVAHMGLLLAPASVLAAVAILWPRRRTEDGS